MLSKSRTGRPCIYRMPLKPGGYGMLHCMLYESELGGGSEREG